MKPNKIVNDSKAKPLLTEETCPVFFRKVDSHLGISSPARGVILTLSGEGITLATTAPLQTGAWILFDLVLASSHTQDIFPVMEKVRVAGEVQWGREVVQNALKGCRFIHGITFTGISRQERKKIIQYLCDRVGKAAGFNKSGFRVNYL